MGISLQIETTRLNGALITRAYIWQDIECKFGRNVEFMWKMHVIVLTLWRYRESNSITSQRRHTNTADTETMIVTICGAST